MKNEKNVIHACETCEYWADTRKVKEDNGKCFVYNNKVVSTPATRSCIYWKKRK